MRSQGGGRRLTPDLLLSAYASGVFPMAQSRESPDVYWLEPRRRGVLPLDRFHISRSLKKRIRKRDFDVRVNTAFAEVVARCADREQTWINQTIFDAYGRLHANGDAHSVEYWRGGQLLGGAYGVTLGGAFFGESMFSLERDASKIALTWLTARLRVGGFQLLDTQFVTDHLMSLGAEEISRDAYRKRLFAALEIEGDFNAMPTDLDYDSVMQRATQIS